MGHVPCEACGSSDAGWLFGDGGFYCYSCGHSNQSGRTGDVNIPPSARKKPLELIDVEVSALGKRHITLETAQKWGYGYGTYKGKRAQVATYRDPSGRAVAQKLRFENKKFMVLGDLDAAGFFGQHLFKSGGRSIIITEGEIDALTVSQVMENKWPVVSIPAGAQGAKTCFKKNLEFLQKYEKVIIMFDMDDPGQKAAIECAELLPPGRAFIASLPLKDPNELLKAGRSSDLVSAFWNARQYRPDNLVTGDDLWAYMKKSTLAPAVPYPYEMLNRMFKGGARRGEVTMIVAGTGTGKSTFCKELAYGLIQEGQKIGYIALEEDVGETMWGLLSVETNKRLTVETDTNILFSPEMEQRFHNLKDKVIAYDHFGSADSENLLSRMRYLAKGEDCSFIFLDHLSIVVSGMDMDDDERRTIDRVMTSLASLAKEANVGIFVVCHLKKPGGSGKSHEEGRQVVLDDLRGSGSLKQLAWNVISLERDQQDTEESHLALVRILKSRKIGKLGLAGTLAWDEDTGRLIERGDEMFADERELVEAGKEFE